MEGVQHHTSGETSLTLDSRYFPIVVGTWVGAMTTQTVRTGTAWVDRMAERARREDVAFVLISDTTRLTEKPRVELRNEFAACIDRINEHDPGRFLRLVVVVRHRMMRAFLAMLLWMLKRKFRISTTGTIDDALTTARALLEAAGVPHPEGLDPSTYRCPAPRDSVLDAGGL